MIALKLAPELEAQVRDAAARRGVAADEFVADAVRQQLGRPEQLDPEAELIARIRRGISQEIRARYQMLNEKRQAETITDDEYGELLSLIERIEQGDAERMTHLVELAQLRNTSLDAVIDDLNLRRKPPYG